jgi:hypothetical protein
VLVVSRPEKVSQTFPALHGIFRSPSTGSFECSTNRGEKGYAGPVAVCALRLIALREALDGRDLATLDECGERESIPRRLDLLCSEQPA